MTTDLQTVAAGHVPSLHKSKVGLAALGALGIVYGDIGTSPLYALKETVKAASGSELPSHAAVLGSVSMIFWSLIFVISVKYAILILWADNRGEGGIVAMLALLGARHAPRRSWRAGVLLIRANRAAPLFGDGAVPPPVFGVG